MNQPDLLHTLQDNILRLTFNRPKRLNALTCNMLQEATNLLVEAATNPDVRLIVLEGAGHAFSSGADLRAAASPTASLDAANAVTRAIRTAPQPVLATVQGPAVGVACAFAIAADIIVAAESAYFLLPFASLGLMPDGGTTALLASAVGRTRAARLALLGERLSAAEALEWGLVTRVETDENFQQQVQVLARQLAQGPSAAYSQVKHAFNQVGLTQLEQALSLERAGQTALFETADHHEGVAAFLEKRPARFIGR